MTTLDKYQAFKHNDGRMLAIVLPSEELFEKQYRVTETHYEELLRKAIANGIEFKEKEDIKYLIITLGIKTESFDGISFEMEKMKPYPLPSDIEIEIKVLTEKLNDGYFDVGEDYVKYAFIKKPEPETESQDGL